MSCSNAFRPLLFEFEECLNGRKRKAACAGAQADLPRCRASLSSTFPWMHSCSQNAAGRSLSIPIPSHPIPPASVAQAKADVATLEALLDDHDAIFLLLDSRENRWPPTMLDFDMLLVKRHGAQSAVQAQGKGRFSYYYFTDTVAPTYVLSFRA